MISDKANVLQALANFSLVVSTLDNADLDSVLWSLRSQHGSGVVVVCRGNKMKTHIGLFNEFASACQFPYYFGENWAAFDECINDLSWMRPGDIVVAISHAEDVLKAEEVQDKEYFFRLMERTVRAWGDGENFDDEEDRRRFVLLLDCGIDNPKLQKEFLDWILQVLPTAQLAIE